MPDKQERYEQPDPAPLSNARGLQLGLSLIIGLSFVGFFVGVRNPIATPVDLEQLPVPQVSAGHVVASLNYAEIQRGLLSPNKDFQGSLSDLVAAPLSAPLPPGSLPREAARTLSLERRQKQRAYAGAPPVIPHPAEQRSSASCLACHAMGLRIGDKLASPLPHPAYASCTQCHVEQQALQPGELGWLRNSFEGQSERPEGSRAWPGAPPSIPHDVGMRSNCLSCHGPNGAPGMRSTHPERTSCLQCHALGAIQGQR